jgi:DNA polymerase
MHAFVRFRELPTVDGSERFVAFFEPDHHIVRRTASFFVNRFTNMQWSILTPELSIHWDGATLTRAPAPLAPTLRRATRLEEMWRTIMRRSSTRRGSRSERC